MIRLTAKHISLLIGLSEGSTRQLLYRRGISLSDADWPKIVELVKERLDHTSSAWLIAEYKRELSRLLLLKAPDRQRIVRYNECQKASDREDDGKR